MDRCRIALHYLPHIYAAIFITNVNLWSGVKERSKPRSEQSSPLGIKMQQEISRSLDQQISIYVQ